MANYVLRIYYANYKVRNIPISRLVAVPAEHGARYELLDEDNMQQVQNVTLKQRGDNLVVEVNHQAVVHINRYYQNGQQGEFVGSSTIAQAPASPTPASPTPEPTYRASTIEPSQTPEPQTASSKWSMPNMGGNMGTILLGGAAVGGLIALAAGSKKSSSDTPSSPSPSETSIVNGTVVAGPVLTGNDLKATIYQADNKTKLAEGVVGTDGKFSLSWKGYSGVVLIQVSSTGSAKDYQDEATSKDKDLSAPLYAAVVANSNSTNNINVNPLTTLAYQKLGANPSADTVNNANSALAKLFGVADLHATGVVTVNGNTNFDANDGLSNGEKYGATLAAFSGADTKYTSIQNTLDKIASGLTISNGVATLDNTALQELVVGAQTYNAATGVKTFSANFLDSTPPSVSSIQISSATGQYGAWLNANDVVSITVAMSETVNVTASPQLKLNLGGNTVSASYDAASSSGSNLVFKYTIQTSDSANNGISIDANSLSGTVKDTIGNAAVLTHAAITANSNYKVSSDNTPPSITSGSKANDLADKSGSGQTIYTINATDVSTPISYSLKQTADWQSFAITNGSVQLLDNPDQQKKASYQFTVVAQDLVGNSSEQNVSLNITTSTDTTPPSISSIQLSAATDSSGGVLKAGSILTASAKFSENVIVTNTPQLALDIGGQTVQANYASGSGSDTLLFNYTIAAGLVDADGIAIAANSLSLNNGTIKDAANNAATLTHNAVDDNNSYKVDASLPIAKLVNPVPVMLEALERSNGDDALPRMTRLDNGAFVTVWRGADNQGTTPSNNSIFVQRFNADGTSNGTATQINSKNSLKGPDAAPEVAALGNNGDFVVSWVNYSDTGARQLQVQKFKADGTTSHALVSLPSFSATFDPPQDVTPKIAALGSDGSFVLTWTAMDYAWNLVKKAPTRSVYVQQFDANGDKVGSAPSAIKVNGTNSWDYNPEVSKLGSNGEFVLAWKGYDSSGFTSIYVQKFKADGSTSGSAVQLGISGQSHKSPQIAELGSNGEYVVTWFGQDSDTGHDYSIFVQKFKADGTVNGSTIQLEANGNTTGSDLLPVITALDSSGKFAVAWKGDNSTGEGATSVFVQLFDATGARVGTQAVQLDAIDESNNANQNPLIQTLANGTFVVAWEGKDVEGDYSIYLQRFNADGSKNGNQIKLESPTFSKASDTQVSLLAPDSSGAFIVSWQGTDAQGDQSIFVQKVNADGSLNSAIASDQTITGSTTVSVESNESGKIYLVNSQLSTADFLADIAHSTPQSPHAWTSVSNTANTPISVSSSGLTPGDYKVYAIDSIGNLSTAASNVLHVSAVSDIRITSTSNTSELALVKGDTVNITVTMYDQVNVSTTSGTPQLGLDIGGKTVQASYKSGSGTDKLVFSYTIQNNDNDSDGIAIPNSSLSLNGGIISEGVTGGANLTNFNFERVENNLSYVVDNAAPEAHFASAGTIKLGNEVQIKSSEVGGVYMVHQSEWAKATSASNIQAITDTTAWKKLDITSPGEFTALSTSDLKAGEYKLYANDELGNFSTTSSSDSVMLSNSIKNDVVVFDLTAGTSSAHSTRSFDSATSYTIYIMTNSNNATMGINSSSNKSWGSWSGAANLGADDKVVLVGNGANIKGGKNGIVDALGLTVKAVSWQTVGSKYAAKLTSNGLFTRATPNLTAATGRGLWNAAWANPNNGKTLNAVYLTKLPAGILTSQGLV